MNKKIIFTIFIVISLILALSTNTFAITRYAFSIGQKGNSLYDENANVYIEDGFAQNANNAWLHYSNLPTISSRVSTSTLTGSYLNSPLPNGDHKLESNVLFLNGHANQYEIVFSYLDDPRYLTGICYGESFTESSTGRVYVGMNTLDFSDTELITFAGCNTAIGEYNLLTKAIQKGAKATVGFTNEIYSRYQQGIRWLNKYNECLASYSVLDAIHNAGVWAPLSNLATSVQYMSQFAYRNLNLYSFYSSNSNNISVAKNAISDSFLTKKLNIPFTANFNYKVIENEIKNIEPDFDINDYEVMEHFYNKDFGDGAIYFYYYIDGVIKTNKVYIAKIRDNVITELTLGGVKKENIQNISSLEESTLIDKIQGKSNVIERNKRIPYAKIDNTAVNSSEYTFDYNTNTLSQVVYYETITKENFIQKEAIEFIL